MKIPRFWSSLDELVKSSELVIDRPKGSVHPRYSSAIYPLDYGFLEGTQSGDLGGIDVWVGSTEVEGVQAIVCTVDMNKLDAEIKIIIGCSQDEIEQIFNFHNVKSQSAILVPR